MSVFVLVIAGEETGYSDAYGELLGDRGGFGEPVRNWDDFTFFARQTRPGTFGDHASRRCGTSEATWIRSQAASTLVTAEIGLNNLCSWSNSYCNF